MKCPECKGTGRQSERQYRCEDCDGTGKTHCGECQEPILDCRCDEIEAERREKEENENE